MSARLFIPIIFGVLCLNTCVAIAEEQSDFERGLALRMENKNAQAVAAFRKVPADCPCRVRALVQLGATLEDLGKKKEALDAYQQVLAIDPMNSSAARNLDQLRSAGMADGLIQTPNPAKEELIGKGLLSLEAGDFKRALEIFKLSRGLFPGDPRPLFYSALTLERQGNVKGAIALYERAIESFPDYVPARIHHVLELFTTGDREGALRSCRNALEANPENKLLRSLSDLLNRPVASPQEAKLNSQGKQRAMRRLLSALAPCLLLPVFCFGMLSYEALSLETKTRLPLLSAYYISSQLRAEIAVAKFREPWEFPPNYRRILQDYRDVVAKKEISHFKPASSHAVIPSLAERAIARFILWRETLPGDFLQKDPIKDMVDQLKAISESERRNNEQRENIIAMHSLDCLRQYALPYQVYVTAKRGLPPEYFEVGLSFCGEKIPLERTDVRRRIEYQIAYLLADFRDTTGVWLKRKDRYGRAIRRILEKENMPTEFALLPALESGYRRMVVSPSMAGGWWQFVRPTAIQSLSKDRKLDWSLRVDSWKDERRDLALSTRSAARYLKWIRSKLSESGAPGSWLTAAAAYNAGVSEIKYRQAAYATRIYWDMKLPAETEDYIPRWIALHIIDGNRRYYGMELPEVNPISFDTLEGLQFARDLPLTHLAVMAECSVNFLREINSALDKTEFSFKAVRNNAPLTHTIHVPSGCGEQILSTLKSKMYLKDRSEQ